MNVTFYNCTADNKKIDKSGYLNQLGSYSMTVYRDCNYLNPVLYMDYNVNILNCNYAYIADFGKWYYITNKILQPGMHMILEFSIDYLYTYANEILSLNVNVERSESNFNSLVKDTGYTSQSNRKCITLQFDSSPFNVSSGYQYVLTVIGGVKKE